MGGRNMNKEELEKKLEKLRAERKKLGEDNKLKEEIKKEEKLLRKEKYKGWFNFGKKIKEVGKAIADDMAKPNPNNSKRDKKKRGLFE